MITKSLALFPFIFLIHLSFVRAQSGLRGDYFNGQNFEEKILTRTDPAINFVWNNVAPAAGLDPHVFSIRWTGKLQTPESGNYRFSAHVDDGIRVRIDGKLVIDAWGLHDSERVAGEMRLEAGRQYDLVVEYFNAINEGEIQLFWQLPSEAPLFGGAFGYNEHLIGSRFFVAPPVAPRTTTPTPRPARPTPAKPAAKPRPPAPKPVVIARDTLEKYIPKNVLFEQSKSIMLPESKPELDRLAGFLLRNPTYTLTIEGHTDHVGDAAKNLLLSEERAQTVAAYLTQKGVTAGRITARGYGDTRPLVQEPPGKPNPVNRRVEFRIKG